MDQADQTPMNQITPEMREAVRSQIIEAGLRASRDIAAATHIHHLVVVRILERFEAVGALHLTSFTADPVGRKIVDDSLSARFQDLTIPLW